ncbi:MAG: N-acetylmuramoyl-L-alanine amidase [Fimbriimonadales bacterium]|nr:N-acetylmuramoyl-L-alanine amidase [Fimbriimonadales bacterium]
MRRLLVLLAAGIAAQSSAALEPDWPVRLSLFEGGPEIQAYERAGELLVRPDELRVLGLSVRLDGPVAQVSRGDSTVRAPLHPQTGKLALAAVAEALGLHLVRPSAERTAATMLATVRRVFADASGFGFESTHPVTVRSFALKEPDRLVVDLKGARLDPSASLELTPPARASQYQPDTVRIVLETAWRVRGGLPETSSGGAWMLEDPNAPPSEVATAEPPSEPQPPRPRVGPIVAVRSAPREETFELRLPSALASQTRLEREAPERIAIRLPASEWIAPDRPLPGVRRIESESSAASTVVRLHLERPMVVRSVFEGGALRFSLVRPEVGDGKLAGKVVVVDAGHGGSDPGAKAPGGGVLEKDLNLAMALEIAGQLTRHGADVILTRASDVFLPLKERSEIANRAKASFFVSVHVNSNRVANSRSGTMVFHHKTDPVGQLLADCIQREIGAVSGLPNLGTWSDGRIYASGFAVLRYATMPAVLLELGFINHGADLRRIRTEDFRKKVASAVVRGLKVFLGDGRAEER